MPTPPAPPPPSFVLNTEDQDVYNRLLQSLGRARADRFKSEVFIESQTPLRPTPPTVPFNLNVRQPQVTPAAPTVPVQGPLGTQIRVPQSSLNQLALLRPSKEVLRADTLKAAGKYREQRIVELVSQGKSRREAEWTANKEAYEKVRTPTSAGYQPVAVGRYSDLALRGKDTLPFMTGMQTLNEASKPQLLETELAAKGRKQFEAMQVAAKANLKSESARLGQTEAVTFSQMFADNKRDAPLLAEQMYGPVDTSIPNGYAMRQEQIEEILAAKNAVLYAIRPDASFFGLDKFASKKAGDILKFVTQDEKYGILTESKGAASLRFLGGLSRFGLNAIERSILKPLAKATVAAFDPNMTYGDFTKLEEDELAAGGGIVSAAAQATGNQPKLSDSAKSRNKVYTGAFVRDTAWDIATGRSAVDDYLDTGMDPASATMIGLLTEFAIPITPIGYLTSVAPAFRSGAAAVGVGADAAVASKAGQALVSSKFGQVIARAAESPQIVKLRAFAKMNVKEPANIGKTLKASPKFVDNLTEAASLRENLIDIIAKEAGDVAQVEKTLQNIELPVTREGIVSQIKLSVSPDIASKTPSGFAKDLTDYFGPGGKSEQQLDTALAKVTEDMEFKYKGDNDWSAYTPAVKEAYEAETLKLRSRAKEVQLDADIDYVQKLVKEAKGSLEASNIAAVRVAYAEAQSLPGLGVVTGDAHFKNRGDLRNKVRAEVINAIPTDDYVFVTERLLVRKSVVKTDDFINLLGDTTRAFTPETTAVQARKLIEDAIKEKYKGNKYSGTDVAEPVAFDAPRSPSVGIPIVNEFPRGGIERLQTPTDRRLTVVEAVQDIRDTMKALYYMITQNDLPAAIVKVKKTFDDVIKGRVSADVYEFMTQTKMLLNALERTQMNVMIQISKSGTKTVLSDYIDARLAKQNEGKTIFDADYSLEKTTDDAGVVVAAKARKNVVNDMVSFFFDNSNLRAVIGDNYKEVVANIIVSSSKGRSTLDAYRDVIKQVRSKYPSLNKVGIGKRFVVSEEMNIDVGAIQWTQSREAKEIFAQKVKTLLPRAFPTPEEINEVLLAAAKRNGVDAGPFISANTKPNLKSKVDKLIRQAASEFIYNNGKVKLEDWKDSFTELFESARVKVVKDAEADLKKLIKRSEAANLKTETAVRLLIVEKDGELLKAFNANKSQAEITKIEEMYNNQIQGLTIKGNQYDEGITRLTDIRDNPGPTTDVLVSNILTDLIEQPLQSLHSTFKKQFALSGYDEGVAVETFSKLVDLPLPPQLASLLKNYFGSLDELKKMRGVLGDNMTYGMRSVSDGLWDNMVDGFGMFTSSLSSRAAVGLTSGVYVPNVKYHAVNHMMAPILLALTSPANLLEAGVYGLVGPANKVLDYVGAPPIKKVPLTRGVSVASIETGNPNEIAFVTPAGISYTNRQLAKLLNENYFGMTQNEYISAGMKLEDIAIEAQAGSLPKGDKGIGWWIDEGMRLFGVNGTGTWAKMAEWTDRSWRKQLFVTSIANGATPTQAIQKAKDAFLDYGKVPPGVRQSVGKHMMFFAWAAMHKIEFLRAMLTKNGASNVIKAANAQRDAHREWGQWLYEDDSTRAKLWSDYIGDYGGAPALDVGPENIMISPMLTTFGPAFHSVVGLGSSDTPGAFGENVLAAGKAGFNEWVDMAFTPVIGYMRDVGMLGNKPVPDIVPAKSIAFHQAQGIEHFEEWMAKTGIEVIPLDQRRLGTETFNDMQYRFSNDSAKAKWAAWELAYTYIGLERFVSDTQQWSLVTGGAGPFLDLPPGMDRQRWSDASVGDQLKFFLVAGTRVKSSSEYDLFRAAMLKAQKDLNSGEVKQLLTE